MGRRRKPTEPSWSIFGAWSWCKNITAQAPSQDMSPLTNHTHQAAIDNINIMLTFLRSQKEQSKERTT
jgi:hypothetical protein